MKEENINIMSDHTTKFFFSDRARACALANTYLSEGVHHVVRCERICSEETSVCIVNNQIISKGSYRDLLFEAWDETGYSFYLAFEFQTQEDEKMPYRVIEYDYWRYKNQYDMLSKREKKKFRPKIVITIMIYLGEKEWKKAVYMSEMVNGPSWLLDSEYFNDYGANVKHIKNAPLEKCPHPEVYELLKAFQDYYMSHEKSENLEETKLGQEEALLFAVVTNNVELLRDALRLKEGEKINMCTFTKKWNRHAEERGEIRGKLQMIKNLMSHNHCSAETAMRMLGIPADEQQIYLPKLTLY